MCGIAGIISPDPSKVSTPVLQQMAASIAHRGNDGQAVWVNPAGNAGFAHRRLSIIDTSAAAAQPMHYLQQYTIVYNGEIFNYIELREDLKTKGYEFHTSSDTEVILAAYAQYKEECVHHFDGMFAFAIWDEEDQSLYCARDRFGEKPFFYFYDERSGAFYFGSEMKALKAAGLSTNTNNYLLLQYLALGYTSDISDASRTFYSTFKKLPAAHYLRFSHHLNRIDIRRYWDIDPSINVQLTEAEAVIRFRDLLTTSVKRRLRSDVSVGASLSGGLDSAAVVSTITGLINPGKVNTFTAVFPGFEKDESAGAQLVADYLQVKNHSIIPTASGFINDFERLAHHQEEPFTSGSVYAQFKAFELARDHGVTVLLDGQGADETLAGYKNYLKWYQRTIFPSFTARKLRDKEIKRLDTNVDLYPEFTSAYRNDDLLYKPVVRRLNDLLYFNSFQYGLEELLRYADRNSMAHGREVRLPFLSYELVGFVFSLPSRYKLRKGFTKWILRETMKETLPDHIVWNKNKIGFEPPQKQWMQEPVMQDYIFEAKKILVKEKILDGSVLKRHPVIHNAYDLNSAEWRYLVAGKMLGEGGCLK